MKMELETMLLVSFLTFVQAAMELPKFNQMKLLYPGYYQHEGEYRDTDILQLSGANNLAPSTIHGHNTAAIRMSLVLNRYGGRHAIGTEPIFLSREGQDSFTGKDGQENIFRNTAFGPFLGAKYGNPVVAKPNKEDHTKTMLPFMGKQGIVRLVSYRHKRAGGHVGLWDCDSFFQSRDWTTEQHIISVEFWEAPDSYCPTKAEAPVPHMEPPSPDSLQLVLRHNYPQGSQGQTSRSRSKSQRRLRHQQRQQRRQTATTFWVQ